MKKFLKPLCVLMSAAVGCALICSCAASGNLIAAPGQHSPVTYEDRQQQSYKSILQSANAFAADFTEALYSDYESDGNLAISPVSVYMALALSARTAAGETREQILSALNVTYEQLQTDFSYLYRSLNYSQEGTTLSTTNSVWMQEGVEYIEECITDLAEKYFCYSYSTDFAGDTRTANEAIRNFIKERTNGLIDQDFQLPAETCFALINTLYLKDGWYEGGDELPLTDSQYDFTQTDGAVLSRQLMRGKYNLGRVQRGEHFSTFYTRTNGGFKLHFVLPDQGYAVRDVFNADAINFVSGITDYGGYDEAANVNHKTRCLFPQFEAEYDGDVIQTLNDNFGITDLFSEARCDLSSLIPGGATSAGERIVCQRIQHVAKLKVDRKGIEGAAVTVVVNAPTSAEPIEEVLYDMVIDRAFGYVLTDPYGTILFTGVVNNI
ncbi:MAG TPA: hypothetical protein IAB94_01300 [Candidatus Coproplasma avicola]|uniref:Serpin domain-containing protein n=1 Tax=Candidatus Coproplasma avicola TaxID=2840744 RepID=A0A9D1E5A5_9FIRM|nr:hypothetical protein [Candidatus Coproplasma avicola]